MNALIAALLLAVPLAAQAQPDDPMGSGECAAARAQLEASLKDEASGARTRAQRLAAARRQAAVACLGPAKGQPQRSGAPQPALTVPAPVIASPPRQAAAPPPSPTSPPVAVPRPVAITTCDPAGCWDSDGRRLNQVGPVLMGPHGLCSTNGGVVNCL